MNVYPVSPMLVGMLAVGQTPAPAREEEEPVQAIIDAPIRVNPCNPEEVATITWLEVIASLVQKRYIPAVPGYALTAVETVLKGANGDKALPFQDIKDNEDHWYNWNNNNLISPYPYTYVNYLLTQCPAGTEKLSGYIHRAAVAITPTDLLGGLPELDVPLAQVRAAIDGAKQAVKLEVQLPVESTETTATLKWNSVAPYSVAVYSGSELQGVVAGNSYKISDLQPATPYTFVVKMVDSEGNPVGKPQSVTVTTKEAPKPVVVEPPKRTGGKAIRVRTDAAVPAEPAQDESAEGAEF